MESSDSDSDDSDQYWGSPEVQKTSSLEKQPVLPEPRKFFIDPCGTCGNEKAGHNSN